MNWPIYLDYNATTPIDPHVRDAMLPYLGEHFGNPSSSYSLGRQAKDAVDKARRQVALLLNCVPDEVIFTSGGTESNNYAIKGTAFAHREKGNHIITAQIEHPAVIQVCQYLEEHDFEITYLPVDEYGLVAISDVERAVKDDTILITIMHANNEVGTIQPIEQISLIAKERGIVFHSDAAQSVGKIETDAKSFGVDLLSLAGHKLYATKGIGALFVKNNLQLTKSMHGAGQESGKRAGTENVPAIVGLGKACEIAKRDLESNIRHMKGMRDRLYNGLKQKLENIRLNGHPNLRLSNTLSISFHGVDAHAILTDIENDVVASAGAACHSGNVEISHVLKAMNVPVEVARGSIRFSVGKNTSEEEIDAAIEVVANAVARYT